MERPQFTVGIEEEYLLVETESRDLVRDPPPELWSDLNEALGNEVGNEFMRSQVEIQTRPCADISEARQDLTNKRRTVCEVAGRYDLHPIAASTHPFADWGQQLHTDKKRYNLLARDMQGVVRRLVISGMHVHVGIPEPDLRIDLMSQVSYFLPHLLALSTSSPFWHGEDTGLKSYRMSVFKALPRTGLPEHFNSWAEYERHVNVLVEAGIFEDASKVWWDVRPSAQFPTLEMRIADICTRVEDGLSIAALYQSLLAMLFSKRQNNQRWRTYSNFLIAENLWRAQRYGINEPLMDFGIGKLVPFNELTEELIQILRKEADRLGCTAELENIREIVRRGTSADRQLAVYEKALAENSEPREALKRVVDFLIEETKVGL
ncbi:MAG: carboxylate-amine ligase [Acidimicrobiia bacterium]|nr:carboxylate-amine ligase [Acidimicrobiia bacterium]NNL70448.1 carboxylate-amine ligase [Acidimicrobiia bacterium]